VNEVLSPAKLLGPPVNAETKHKDDPYVWILEMERWNRDVEKCKNGP
jgi:hypothetical protein